MRLFSQHGEKITIQQGTEKLRILYLHGRFPRPVVKGLRLFSCLFMDKAAIWRYKFQQTCRKFLDKSSKNLEGYVTIKK